MNDNTDKAIAKLTDNIDQLIAAAKKVAPHVWETTVRQVQLENWLMLGAWVLTVVGGYVLTRLALRLYSDPGTVEDEGRYSHRSDTLDFMTVAVSVCAGACVITAFIMALAGGPATITALLNPEYVAAERLLWVLK